MNKAIRIWMLEIRYQNAKKRAERYLRRHQNLIDKTDRQMEIMQTVADEQKKIMREMEVDEILGDP